MDVNDVPQDPKDFKEGDKLHKLVYATDKDGKYVGVNSAGWEAENVAMKQAWDAVESDLLETKLKVISGELSPIAFFMQNCLMDIALVAKYVGKWQWQVRRHMKPEVFARLDNAVLNVYAQTFNISKEELINFGKQDQVST
ncbi:MAG: hypothetical protein H0X33_12390 [Taibaiella sp.]|nr:hypothetical protein [Taibaiella sp.]